MRVGINVAAYQINVLDKVKTAFLNRILTFLGEGNVDECTEQSGYFHHGGLTNLNSVNI